MKNIKITVLFQLVFAAIAWGQDSILPKSKLTVEGYIEKYSSLAVEEMFRSHIPASITLAQGILESGNGNSRLCTEANNHFGIKCKSTWTGETVYEDDDAPNECFRKYATAIDSYRDHSDFIMKNVRYSFLFDLEPTDYQSWAYGLKRAGYATNPQYAELLITFIEKHSLHRFDLKKMSEEENKENEEQKVVIQKSYGHEVMINGVPGVVAKPSQSYAQIALDYDQKVYQIYRNNDLKKDAICVVGDTVYLKPKKNKSEIESYIVTGNETMWQISQRFAVKLDRLLDRNKMVAGEEPALGERIQLKYDREKPPTLRDTSQYVVTKIQMFASDSLKMDTIFNEKVYDNPILNIETQKPVEPKSVIDTAYGVKENLSFFHTVQKGETLYGIGKKYEVQVDAIKYLNLLSKDSIEIGQRLIINPEIKSAETKDPQPIPGVHIVRQHETLFSIAKLYNIKISDIKSTNNLSSDQINIGQQLIIVPSRGESTEGSPSQAAYYHVQSGENWYQIARKFGLREEELRTLNAEKTGMLKVGDKIQLR